MKVKLPQLLGAARKLQSPSSRQRFKARPFSAGLGGILVFQREGTVGKAVQKQSGLVVRRLAGAALYAAGLSWVALSQA